MKGFGRGEKGMKVRYEVCTMPVLKHWRRITVSFKERNKEFHKESQRIKLLDGNQWIIYNKIYLLVFFI